MQLEAPALRLAVHSEPALEHLLALLELHNPRVASSDLVQRQAVHSEPRKVKDLSERQAHQAAPSELHRAKVVAYLGPLQHLAVLLVHRKAKGVACLGRPLAPARHSALHKVKEGCSDQAAVLAVVLVRLAQVNPHLHLAELRVVVAVDLVALQLANPLLIGANNASMKSTASTTRPN